MSDGPGMPPVVPPSAALPLASAPPPRRRVRAWPFLLGAMALAVVAVVGLGAASLTPERVQWFHDANVAWAEPLPDDVAAIAGSTGMSLEGELIYRASRPAVEDDDDFNEHCELEGGAVLGCYSAGRIYVYAVTDVRLEGTVEVTAAHEMLHAAYARLPGAERERIDALVEAAVAALPADDPNFADLELYDPSQELDEWHSRLATEYADLDPELEAHYARYFADRALVVELNERATALFRELQDQIDALVAEIDALDPVLDARIAAYEAAIQAYNADVGAFNARADSGAFSSQQQFDRERAALVARGDALDAEYAALQADIDYYNGLVDQLTALDADYADLYDALDSTGGGADVSP